METRVSRDAQNVCAVTKVRTVLKAFSCCYTLDCSQSPYFSVGFSRPVCFDGAAVILVCKSECDLGRVSQLPRGAGVGVSIELRSPPLGSLDTPQIALAFTNQDGGSSIEAYRSRESHGKIGGL